MGLRMSICIRSSRSASASRIIARACLIDIDPALEAHRFALNNFYPADFA